MSLAKQYLEKLKDIYINRAEQVEEWSEFKAISYGASGEDLEALLEVYPDTPKSLIEMASFYRLYE